MLLVHRRKERAVGLKAHQAGRHRKGLPYCHPLVPRESHGWAWPYLPKKETRYVFCVTWAAGQA